MSIEGEVTFEGAPVEEGKISFIPLPGTASPTAGATIKDGRFVIDAEKGLKAGDFEVSITAARATGKKLKDEDSGGMYDEMEPYIPPRYNRKTELRAEIKAGEENMLTYKLTGA